MTEIQQAMSWLLSGHTGLSSECIMATLLSGGKVNGADWYHSTAYPRDPSDFKRCVELLKAVPSFRERLDLMKGVSNKWAVLVEHWDELENLLNEEIKNRSAPKTYDRMKQLLMHVEG